MSVLLIEYIHKKFPPPKNSNNKLAAGRKINNFIDAQETSVKLTEVGIIPVLLERL
jgi:hypothetical protein